jgi:CBS-domain-containing membrane protein
MPSMQVTSVTTKGAAMKVRDAMTPRVITVTPEASLKEAAVMLTDHAIGGLPVLEGDGSLVGVVTEADILVKEGGEPPSSGLQRLLHRDEASALEAKVQARTVREAMSTPAVTVEADRSISLTAGLMLEHGINRLPVIDHGELVGIVTRHDLVRAFARSDEAIEQDIRDEAFAGVSWTESLRLMVQNGEVTLRGEVDSKFDAEAMPELIRRIPGVVSVDSELTTWDVEGKKKIQVSAHRA